MTCSHTERPGTPAELLPRPEEGGFTLLELTIAMMVLAIVMAALAPAFYGMMRASVASDQRSTADGLAVAASEQIRSLPYYQVGYATTPTYCTGANPVQLTAAGPMDTAPTQSTVAGVKYTIDSCVYWVDATDGKTEAYKSSVVRILWGRTNQYSYTQVSALYPGGETAYSGPANDFVPGGGSTSTGTTPPPNPVANSATPFTSSPTTTIEVDWQPVTYSGGTVQYTIEWWTSSVKPASPSSVTGINGTADGTGGLVYQISALTPGVTYNFDVIATSGTQTSGASNVVTTATTSASTSGCSVSSINVTPSSPPIDSSGNLIGTSNLSITVQAAAACDDLSVRYGINGSSGTPTGTLTTVNLSYVSGSFTGQTTQSSWSDTTYGFVVYKGGNATSAQANVTPCKERGNSGHC